MRISDWSSDVCSSDLVLHRGVIRIEEDAELGGVEILRILDRRSFLDPVGIVEHDAKVANAADAGFGTDGRLAGLYARVAEDAFLRLSRGPVVIDFLEIGRASCRERVCQYV